MSLYYGRSPYLQQGRKRKYSYGRRREWSVFGKKARRNISANMVKTGRAVKDGTAAFAQAVQVAKNIKSGKFRYEIGPTTMIMGLIIVAVSLSLIYLAHFNSVATKGYEIRRLEADRQQLMTQYDIKNMKLAEARALATIIESDKAGGMRRPGQVEFIKGNTALASR